MSFWSSQTLEARAGELVDADGQTAVDCNAFQLRVGSEIFVTPHLDDADHTTKQRLDYGEAFAIPPQQFAFVLTEERVRVPTDAMAFISMRATFKMQGLVNVSGFHVDPGWEGKLIFAVYNAGPSPVHLERGLPLFLIWYADLDQPSDKHKTVRGPDTIEPQRISALTRPMDSLYALNKRLVDEAANRQKATDDLRDRVHAVEKAMVGVKVRTAVVLTALISVTIYLLRSEIAALVSEHMQ